MRRSAVFFLTAMVALGLASLSRPQCPEDPYDSGICDTLYVELYPDDQWPCAPGPFFVRFPIYVTHDIVDPTWDSIAGFVIPLCYTSDGPGYCSLSGYWNQTTLSPFDPAIDRSVFRDLPDNDNPVIYNRMFALDRDLSQRGWDFRFIDFGTGTDHFWLSMVPTGSQDQLWWEGSRVLLATMTFKVSQECRSISIDSCFWPPGSGLRFANRRAENYIPRHFLPVSHWYGIPGTWIECPLFDRRYANGTYQSDHMFWADCEPCGHVSWVEVASPPPPGIADVGIAYNTPPGGQYADGHIVYTVTDHCQSGGLVWLRVYNNVVNMWVDECWFDIELSNTVPGVVPETVIALAQHALTFNVYGDDPDCDSVEAIEFETLWFEPDSSQPPTNPPSCQDGYPAILTWSPAEADTGSWLCSFSATDACGGVGSDQVAILVGMPFCGDCNQDGTIAVGDGVFLLNYLFKGASGPDPLCRGDANCDSLVDLGDIVTLLNFLYKGGSAPCLSCCDE